MKFSTPFYLCCAFSSLTQAVTLIDALNQAGASEFAELIQADPAVAAVFSSKSVQMVFAPINGCIRPSSSVAKRQAGFQDSLYQGMNQANAIGAMSVGSGKKLTSNKAGNLGPNTNQSVVSNPSNAPANNITRRWNAPKLRDTHSNTTFSTYPSLLRIYSGLGNNVSIIKADIPYDGGLIHVTDGYFTSPQPLSSTANANGHTTFTALAASSNLTTVLDSTPAITCFIPSNAAFSAPNSTSKYSSGSSLLGGHIIPNFLGYLPELTDGATYKTQDGTNVTITIRGGDYYVNNAKIVASNQILENGVAHVVDSVITPSKQSPPVVVVSAAFLERPPHFAVMTATTLLLLAFLSHF